MLEKIIKLKYGYTDDLIELTEKKYKRAKDPGFNIKKFLHRKVASKIAYTGKGVKVLVIDAGISKDYKDIEEYGDRIFGEIQDEHIEETAHTAAVLSILAGKTCGVAPDVDIMFFGNKESGVKQYEKAAEQILYAIEYNKDKKQEDKIRAISCSKGYMIDKEGNVITEGAEVFHEATKKTAEAGIFTVTNGDMMGIYGFDMFPLRCELDDIGDIAGEYKPALTMLSESEKEQKEFFENEKVKTWLTKTVGIPVDCKVVSGSGKNKNGFVYMDGGKGQGFSWIPPYLVGVYALACQANLNITPEKFSKHLLNTRDKSSFCREKIIINPIGIVGVCLEEARKETDPKYKSLKVYTKEEIKKQMGDKYPNI